MDLQNVTTHDLVKELQNREGVKSMIVDPYAAYQIDGEGPVVVLIVED